MAFLLIEHECKPVKLKGNKVVPSIISPLRGEELKHGEYIGIMSKYRIKLLNYGGFVGYTPQMKKVAYLSKEIPATLDENACSVLNGELFIPLDRVIKVHQVVFNKIVTGDWIYSDLWVPSQFFNNDIYIGEGWFRLNDQSNQAIIISEVRELELPVKVSAIYDSKIICECFSIYSIEHYEC